MWYKSNQKDNHSNKEVSRFVRGLPHRKRAATFVGCGSFFDYFNENVPEWV